MVGANLIYGVWQRWSSSTKLVTIEIWSLKNGGGGPLMNVGRRYCQMCIALHNPRTNNCFIFIQKYCKAIVNGNKCHYCWELFHFPTKCWVMKHFVEKWNANDKFPLHLTFHWHSSCVITGMTIRFFVVNL